MTEIESGDPGQAVSCMDVRSGSAFRFQAQRLMTSGVVDTLWTPDSSQVCVGSADGLAQRLVPDGSGGAFVAWVDPREGYPDVRLGRVDASGNTAPGWTAEGLTLSPFRASRDQVAACSDGAGGAYVAWSEFRGAARSTVRLVRVGANGALSTGWPAGGVQVGEGATEQAHPWLVAVGGGALVTWLERQAGGLGISAQRIGANGDRVAGWPVEGVRLVAAPTGSQVVFQRALARGGSDVLLVWREEQGEHGSVIRAVQTSLDLLPVAQAPPPVTLSGEAGLLSDPAVVPSGEWVFIAWSELAASTEGVRLRRLTVTGAIDPAWPATGVVVAQTSVGFDPPAVLPGADGGAILAWTDRREIASGDIYAGRVRPDGTCDPDWPESGLGVCTALGDQYRPSIVPDGSGGAIVSWLDVSTQSVAGFLSLSPTTIGRIELVETSLDPGRVRLAWLAPSSGNAIYRAYRRGDGSGWFLVGELTPNEAGRLELDDRAAPEGQSVDYALSVERDGIERFLAPVSVSVPVTPERLALRQVRLSGSGDAIRVEFALPRGPEAQLEFIDVAGRRVGERRLTGYEPGVRVAEVRGHGRIRAGVYFVRLRQGAVVLTQKFVAVQ